MHRSVQILICLAVVHSVALADGDPPAATPAPSGATFRNGFSASVGEEFGSGPSSGLSGQLYGVDWRIGAKINDSIAVYLDTHLSLGTAKIGASSGVTGNFASAIVGEYTIAQQIFIGVGAGYGVLNNPSGALAQVRVGWYPFTQASAQTQRHFNIAADARWYFAGADIGTVTQLALTIGYDRF